MGTEVGRSVTSAGKNNQVGPLIVLEWVQNSSVVTQAATESIRSPWRFGSEQYSDSLRNRMAEFLYRVLERQEGGKMMLLVNQAS